MEGFGILKQFCSDKKDQFVPQQANWNQDSGSVSASLKEAGPGQDRTRNSNDMMELIVGWKLSEEEGGSRIGLTCLDCPIPQVRLYNPPPAISQISR